MHPIETEGLEVGPLRDLLFQAREDTYIAGRREKKQRMMVEVMLKHSKSLIHFLLHL